MADYQVARARVDLEVNDHSLKSEMAAAEAAVHRAVQRMDREKATIEVEANLAELKRDLAKAEALVKAWEAKSAAAATTGQRRYRTAQLKKAQAARDAASAAVAASKATVAAMTAENRTLDRQARSLGRVEAAERRLEAAKRRQAKSTREAAHEARKADDVFSRWIKSVTHMTLRVGPFTAQLHQFAKAMVILGPVITGLAGSLGALTSVLGFGLVGALGVTTAGLAGFALAAGGVAAILKPLKQDFDQIKSRADAYHTAVLKYGKASEQAAAKQEQFRRTLKGIAPSAREGWTALGQLGDRWRALTKPGRKAGVNLIGEGLAAIDKMLPMFAARTNRTMQVLRKGMGEWFKGLSSTQGRDVLGGIMGNFTKALPAMLSGLGQLTAAFGRLSRSFLRPEAFGALMGAFDAWATRLNGAAKNTQRLNDFTTKSVQAFRDVIQLGGALGRVFGGLFGAALPAGTRMVDRMTTSLNGLADRMGTLEGRIKLQDFFQRSADTAQKLVAVLKPLFQLFFEFATIARPISDTLLDIAGALARLTAAAANLGVVRGFIQLLLTGLVVQRVTKFAAGILGLAAAFRTLATAAGTSAAVGALMTGKLGAKAAALGAGEAAALGAAAGTAAPRVSLLSRALSALKAAGPRAAGALGLAAGAVTALGIAVNKLEGDDLPDKLAPAVGVARAKQELDAYSKSWNQVIQLAPDFGSALQSANARLRASRDALKQAKKGTDEYKYALQENRDAVREQIRAKEEWAKVENAIFRNADGQVGALRKMLRAVSEIAARDRDNVRLQQAKVRITRQLAAALNVQAAATVNAARMERGMLAVRGGAAQQLGSLARQRPQLAQTIGLKFQVPGNAGAVADQALRSLRAGVNLKAVLRIVADARGAKDAISDLQNARLKAKQQDIRERGGAQVLGQLRRINGTPLPDKSTTIRANDAASPTIRAIQAALAGIPNSKSITISVTRIERSFGGRTGGQGRATGGPVTPEQKSAARGARVDRTTFVAGEEGRTEYVIATNPAYRASNMNYLAQAADHFGMALVPAYKKGKGKYDVPRKIKVGAIPLNTVENRERLAEQSYDRMHDLAKEKRPKDWAEQVRARKRVWDHRKADLKAAKAINSRINHLEEKINLERQRMENASTKGDTGAFEKARGRRLELVDLLTGVLQRAIPLAGGRHKTKLLTDLASLRGDTLGSKPAFMDLDSFLTALGFGGELGGHRLAISKAAGTLGDADDKAANLALAQFLEGRVIPGLQGVKASDSVLTEAFDLLASARSGAGLLEAPGSAASDDSAALIAQLEERLRITQRESAINAAYGLVAGGPGDIGMGAFSARAAGITQNIYTLHPGDPHTLAAIAGAATAGLGYQGAAPAVRSATGY
jgi:hypothetical protein